MARLHARAGLASALVLAACSLDGVGKQDPDAITGTTIAASAGTTVSGGPTTDTTSAGQGGDGGEPVGPGPGSGGDGATGQGGAVQATSGPGGSGQGGAGPGGGGQGGTGQGGGAGGGGSGSGGSTTTGEGGGGSGGAPPSECGNGVLEPGEQCDAPIPECDVATCTLIGECALSRQVSFEPGGVSRSDDTTVAPNTTDFGTCANTAGAPVHLYRYTTGPVPAYVQVVVEADATGLADPVLSFHTSCLDDSIASCLQAAPCCSNALVLQNEIVTTDVVPASSLVTVAVSGALGDDGHYDITFRDYRYLFLETFEPPPGQFTAAGSASTWAPTSGAVCDGGSQCMGLRNDGMNHDAETLTSVPFSAPGIGGAALGWHQRIDDAFFNGSDSYRVEVSVDGGFGWTPVYTHPQGLDETSNEQVDVSFIAGAEDVRIRFVIEDGGGDVNAWYVDTVYVIAW